MEENEFYKNLWNMVENNELSTDKYEKNKDANKFNHIDESDNKDAKIIRFRDETDHIKEGKRENFVEEKISKDNKDIDAKKNQVKEMKYDENEKNYDEIKINDTKNAQKEIIRPNFKEKNGIVNNQKIQFNNSIIIQQNENFMTLPKLKDKIKTKTEENPPLLNGDTQINDIGENNNIISSTDDFNPFEFNIINDFPIKEKSIYSEDEQLPDLAELFYK